MKCLYLCQRIQDRSDEANNQCNEIEKIIKNYSKDGMLVGEAACTRDLIKITDKDFDGC